MLSQLLRSSSSKKTIPSAPDRSSTGAGASFSKRPLLAASAALAVVIGLTGFAAVPAQAASTTAVSASAAAAVKAAVSTALESVVVPSGGQQVISLGTLPAGANSVTLKLDGAGAWQNTDVKAAIGPNGAQKLAFTATKGGKPSATITLPLQAGHNGKLTLTSSQASVRVNTTITNIGVAAAPAASTTPAGSLESVVVPSGGQKTISLGTVPAGATSVKFTLAAAGAWQSTQVKASVGPNGPQQVVYTVAKDAKPSTTVTLPLQAGHNGKLTLTSSAASVKLSATGVTFGAGSSTPAPAPTTAPAPAPAPAPTPAAPATGTPSSSNTGVPSGTKLTVHNGDLNITKAGTVIDGQDIRGLVKISAPNVTIKNSVIRGRALTGIAPLINNLGGQSGLKIVDTELFPSTASPYAMGIYGYNFTATRVNIHGVIDSIHLTGGNVVIEKSWLHDNLHYSSDPNHGGSPSHDDSIQIQKGDNIKVLNNNISGAFNSGIQITQDTGKVSNFTFTGNYANGGGCTVNIAEKSYGPVQGVKIADNTFGRDTKVSNCAVIAKSTTKIDLARNYYVPDKTLVTVHKG